MVLISVTSYLCPKHLLDRWSVNVFYELLINPTSAPELNRAQNKVELQLIAHLQVAILLFRSEWELGIAIFNSVFIFSGP